jgi:hypothetical protein
VRHWDGHTLNVGGVSRLAAEHRSVVSSGSRRRDEMESEAGGGKSEQERWLF